MQTDFDDLDQMSQAMIRAAATALGLPIQSVHAHLARAYGLPEIITGKQQIGMVLGVSVRTVSNYIYSGTISKIVFRNRAGSYCASRESLVRWMAERNERAEPVSPGKPPAKVGN